MVGMPEIYILGIGKGSKMLAIVCWKLMCFLCFCAGKIAGKYTNFKQKSRKNFYRKL